MSITRMLTSILVGISLSISMELALAQPADAEMLTGDRKLACEAIICLFAGSRAPGECTEALTRYFTISAMNTTQTATARQNFLNLCPRR